MLDFEILKQAMKEHEEQENEAEQYKREQLAYKREQLAYKRAELEHKKRQQAKTEEPPKKARGSGAVVASLVISFASFAIMAIFYIILLLKY